MRGLRTSHTMPDDVKDKQWGIGPKEESRLRFKTAAHIPPKTEVVIHLALRSPSSAKRAYLKTVGELSLELPSKAEGCAVLTVCAGSKTTCDAEAIRRAAGAAARWVAGRSVTRVAVEATTIGTLDVPDAVETFCEGFALGAFRFDLHRTGKKRPAGLAVTLVASRAGARLRRTLDRVTAITESVNLAREWGHEPPNVINPVTLAERVRRLARTSNLKCRVYDERQLAKMKAGALLSVGVASKTPSRLIVLEYAGARGATKAKPVVLVGKAVTFDTGGYSLKDKDGIVGMKYDKCGGMAVVGAMRAVAALKPRTPVVGVIAAAENMISGEAYRPNDIITTMSGKTVEIISTDAEGRLVLADALTYAQQTYRPRAIIDLATLTGGVVVALGAVRAGLFANDSKLADALTSAGDRVHERLWRLPLDDDYYDLIKGDDSDLKNSGGRSAHPIIGGMFLKQFVDDRVPWAHLDIAGTATCDKDEPCCPKGATGFGVRLLVNYIERL